MKERTNTESKWCLRTLVRKEKVFHRKSLCAGLYQLCLEPVVLLLLFLQLFGKFSQFVVSSLTEALLFIKAGLYVCQ